MVTASKERPGKTSGKGKRATRDSAGAKPKRRSKAPDAPPAKRGRGRPKATLDAKYRNRLQYKCTDAELAIIKANYAASPAAASGLSESRWAVARLLT